MMLRVKEDSTEYIDKVFRDVEEYETIIRELEKFDNLD